MKKVQIISLIPLFIACLLLFVFAGCKEEEEEDLSVNSITIFNIPKTFPAHQTSRLYCNGAGCDGDVLAYRCLNTGHGINVKIRKNDTPFSPNTALTPFSIYLNVSNNMSSGEVGKELLPEAKGYAQFFKPGSTTVLNGNVKEENGKYTVTVYFMDPNTGYGMPPYNWRDKEWRGTANYFSVSISPQDITTNGLGDTWIKGGLTLDNGKDRWDWEKLMDFRNTSTIDYTDQADELYHLIVSADKNIESGTRPMHFGYPHEPGQCGDCSLPAYQNNPKLVGKIGCQKYVNCKHDKTNHPTYPVYFPDYETFVYKDWYVDGKFKGGNPLQP